MEELLVLVGTLLLGCAVICVIVWALFLLGSFLGLPWYVSAVAILLMGRFVFGTIENW